MTLAQIIQMPINTCPKSDFGQVKMCVVIIQNE